MMFGVLLCALPFAASGDSHMDVGFFSLFSQELNYTYNETNMTLMPKSKMAPAPGGKPVTTVVEVTGPISAESIAAVLAAVTDDSTTATAEALAACPAGQECSAEVVKKIVITVVHSFVVPCDSLPTVADYVKTYAAAMEVDASSVAVDIVSETGCGRLLANGERRLSTGTHEVSAKVSYPEGDTAAVVAASQDTDLVSKLTSKLESEASIVATVTQVTAPSVGVETEVAVSTSVSPTSAPTTMEPTMQPTTVEPTAQPTPATASPTLAPSNATEAPTNVTEEESRAALTGAGLLTVAVAAFSLISTAL